MLGDGNVARAPATGWAATGHDVVMGSHRPKDGEDPGPAVAAERGDARAYGLRPPPEVTVRGAPIVTSC
ncbi:hypothetical protein ACFRR7_22520 [Streptomyces sp. NPDC056909]|uniref:hypothetical protein n=1 Tax=Streptomyces sp. NPDC056909 TaxID=3345963 RepID=UPI0036CC4881